MTSNCPDVGKLTQSLRVSHTRGGGGGAVTIEEALVGEEGLLVAHEGWKHGDGILSKALCSH
jgi:hypothetical protein